MEFLLQTELDSLEVYASPLRLALSKQCCTKLAKYESRALYGVTQRLNEFPLSKYGSQFKSLLLQICIYMALTGIRELHAPSPPSAAHALLT